LRGHDLWAAFFFFVSFAIIFSTPSVEVQTFRLKKKSVDDLDAHGTRGAFDDQHRGLVAGRIEVLALRFDDLKDLLAGHLAHLVLVRDTGPLGNASSLLQEDRRREGTS
jgi:hypothetical protein